MKHVRIDMDPIVLGNICKLGHRARGEQLSCTILEAMMDTEVVAIQKWGQPNVKTTLECVDGDVW